MNCWTVRVYVLFPDGKSLVAGADDDVPEMTRRLLDQIHYPKKGIMLDTGHLMHTNLELRTEEEAIGYILEKIKAHGEGVLYPRNPFKPESDGSVCEGASEKKGRDAEDLPGTSGGLL